MGLVQILVFAPKYAETDLPAALAPKRSLGFVPKPGEKGSPAMVKSLPEFF